MFHVTVPTGHLSSAGEVRIFLTQHDAIAWFERNCVDGLIQDESGKDMCLVESSQEPTKLRVIDIRFINGLEITTQLHIALENLESLKPCLDGQSPTVEVSGIPIAII